MVTPVAAMADVEDRRIEGGSAEQIGQAQAKVRFPARSGCPLLAQNCSWQPAPLTVISMFS